MKALNGSQKIFKIHIRHSNLFGRSCSLSIFSMASMAKLLNYSSNFKVKILFHSVCVGLSVMVAVRSAKVRLI